MVLGKFYPPHHGHVHLFEFARQYMGIGQGSACQNKLSFVVETQRHETIPGELRFQWVQRMFPDVNVIHFTEENPQHPSEHPDFWNIWKTSLERALPAPLDYVFASEEYGWKLAEVLEAQFVPVDIQRQAIPISGTSIRDDPIGNWDFLPPVTRPYFTKRVCVFGPESTGKSTLAKNLAAHFRTVFVPEYARTHLEPRDGKIARVDMRMIAAGQAASEDALVYQANRVLFADTDLLATVIWSHWLFDECDEWIYQQALNRSYDLYLLTDVDVPWVEDAVRYLPKERKSFLEKCQETLDEVNRPYVMISGDWDQRLASAIAAVEPLLKPGNA